MKIYTKLTRRASVLALFGVLAVTGCGQNPNPLGVTDTGTVVGTIVDAAHPTTAVATATISIGNIVRRLSPADNGGFSIENVPTGSQPLHIDSPGYQPYNTTVVVRKDTPANVGQIGLVSSTGL